MLALPVRWSQRAIRVLVGIVVATRPIYPLLDDTLAVMLATGVGVAAALLLLPLLLKWQGHDGSSGMLAGGLALAVSASIALRALGSGIDASTSGLTQLVAWPAALFAVWRWPPLLAQRPRGETKRPPMRVLTLCLGIVSGLLSWSYLLRSHHHGAGRVVLKPSGEALGHGQLLVLNRKGP